MPTLARTCRYVEISFDVKIGCVSAFQRPELACTTAITEAYQQTLLEAR